MIKSRKNKQIEADFKQAVENLRKAEENKLKAELALSKAMYEELVLEKNLIEIQLKLAPAEAIEKFSSVFLERLQDIRIVRDIHDEEEADLDIDDVYDLVEEIKEEMLEK
jgi:urease gamma subunit